MSGSLRVPLVAPGSAAEAAAVEQRLLDARGSVSRLYQVLLNSVPVASGWEQLLTAVRQQTSVPADLRELVILRVAVLNGAPYEFDAHVPHALEAGLAREQIDALRDAEAPARFGAREREVLELTDAMTRAIEVPDALWEPLAARYDARALVELVTTVAAYNMVSRLLVALRVGHR
jgi:AhpD family alkylhydroperoxidase